eukprot:1529038-Rhodomonas_salina.2
MSDRSSSVMSIHDRAELPAKEQILNSHLDHDPKPDLHLLVRVLYASSLGGDVGGGQLHCQLRLFDSAEKESPQEAKTVPKPQETQDKSGVIFNEGFLFQVRLTLILSSVACSAPNFSECLHRDRQCFRKG